jgi:mRNA-degrading endonuclease RelE of RelBE toxin-antitoxin system
MKSLARLDPPIQSAVKIAIFDLQTNPRTPGFNLEKLLGNDFYSGRINDNLRLIMDMDGDRPVVLYVDSHDDAYRWAE